MDDVWATLSFGVGRKNSERIEYAIFDRGHAGWDLQATGPLRQKAESQLGTIGSGNHCVDLFTDEEDCVWIGVHFGSRDFGHGVATWFLKAGRRKGRYGGRALRSLRIERWQARVSSIVTRIEH